MWDHQHQRERVEGEGEGGKVLTWELFKVVQLKTNVRVKLKQCVRDTGVVCNPVRTLHV